MIQPGTGEDLLPGYCVRTTSKLLHRHLRLKATFALILCVEQRASYIIEDTQTHFTKGKSHKKDKLFHDHYLSAPSVLIPRSEFQTTHFNS